MSATRTFSYRALRQGGTLERGTLAAENADDALSLLTGRGLFPLEVLSARSEDDGRPRLPADDLAAGLRALATLLESGLPIGRALATLGGLAPPSWAPVVPALGEAVRQGQTLAAAFEGAPVRVPPLTLGLIRAGEAGSGLARAVARAAALAEEEAATRRAIRAELAYPLLLLASGGASIAVIVGFVLPRFAAILGELGSELPATTRLVLGAAAVARALWLPALTAALLGPALLRLWISTPDGMLRWHAWLLALPGVGTVRRRAAASRFAAALGGLLDAGVPIAAALQGAAGAAGDAALSARLLAARRRVVGGSSLSGALEVEEAATPTLVRLARAGEETGRLGEMLGHAGRIEAEAARARLRAAIRLLQPMLVLGFGAAVALVAAALLQAIYRVRPGG